jgi:hypothetical protein
MSLMVVSIFRLIGLLFRFVYTKFLFSFVENFNVNFRIAVLMPITPADPAHSAKIIDFCHY